MRPRIYYLHATQASLSPTAGDKINEMATIRALSVNCDVYYNGELVRPTDQTFGRGDGQIVVPEAGKYDLIYVRANREVFLAAPSPKILMATPYDAECFAAADGLVVTTEIWKERLERFSAADTDYFMGIYPSDFKPNVPILLFDQVFDTPSDSEIARFRSVFSSMPVNRARKRSALEILKAPFVRRADKARKVMAHLGPIKSTNYPHQLLQAYRTDGPFRKTWTVRAYGAGKKSVLPPSVENLDRVSFDESLAVYASIDATWMNHNQSVNFVGSLKTIHAMAFGVPILVPAFDTPVRRLGSEYPLLWQPAPDQPFNSMHPDFDRAMASLIALDDAGRREMSAYLRDRSRHFSTERVATALRDQIETFLSGWATK